MWGVCGGHRGLRWQRHFESKWVRERKTKERSLPTGEILLWLINFRKVDKLEKNKQTQKLKYIFFYILEVNVTVLVGVHKIITLMVTVLSSSWVATAAFLGAI